MGYALSTTVRRPFAAVLDATRSALSQQGFGILTEIDRHPAPGHLGQCPCRSAQPATEVEHVGVRSDAAPR